MKTIGARIKFVRTAKGMTQQQFADFLGGVTRGAIGNWELEKGITAGNMETVARKTGVSLDWLMTGRGEPPEGAPPSQPRGREPARFVDRNGEDIAASDAGILEIDAEAGLGGGQAPDVMFRAGSEGWQVTDAMRPEPWILPSRFLRDGLRARPQDIVAIMTRGDSMAPTISHGDVVFVDTRHTRISPPGLYAIRDIYGEIIIKRLDVRRDGENIVAIITSDNPREPRREEPLSEIGVVGRVCGRFNLM